MPAAALASRIACGSARPLAQASASTAITVSPAPDTSNTSRARAGFDVISSSCARGLDQHHALVRAGGEDRFGLGLLHHPLRGGDDLCRRCRPAAARRGASSAWFGVMQVAPRYWRKSSLFGSTKTGMPRARAWRDRERDDASVRATPCRSRTGSPHRPRAASARSRRSARPPRRLRARGYAPRRPARSADARRDSGSCMWSVVTGSATWASMSRGVARSARYAARRQPDHCQRAPSAPRCRRARRCCGRRCRRRRACSRPGRGAAPAPAPLAKCARSRNRRSGRA